MAKKIDENILFILDRVRVEGNVAFLPGLLDRKDYEAVNKVLVALGGKWNRKAKGHVFEDDPQAVLESVILTGEYTDSKALFGFFETPEGLADHVVTLADIKSQFRVLEPSAGKGALLDAIRRKGVEPFTVALEIQNKNCTALKLKNHTPAYEVDFLKLKPIAYFNRIVMNPPFSCPGIPQADILHVRHAWDFLAPGGRLVAIMSAGVMFRQNQLTKNFQNFVDAYNGSFEENPEGAFKTSGTMVRTVTLVMDKEREAA